MEGCSWNGLGREGGTGIRVCSFTFVQEKVHILVHKKICWFNNYLSSKLNFKGTVNVILSDAMSKVTCPIHSTVTFKRLGKL